MSSPFIKLALERAGGIGAVANALNMTAEGVRLWIERGIPDKRVLWLAERTQWEFSPNKLAPDLYPHPEDGLPVERRNGSAREGLRA